jgi:hypothetical protein
MSDPFPFADIRDAVQAIRDVELKNLAGGLHLPANRGRRKEVER